MLSRNAALALFNASGNTVLARLTENIARRFRPPQSGN
jgi:hypothetical protein